MVAARKYHLNHIVACFLLACLLAGCDMPMRPDGIDIEAMTQIGDQLRAQGDDVGAAGFYQRALQRVPKDTRARKALAEILEAHGNLAEAATQYQQGLALDPQNVDLLKGYGRILLKQGQVEAAKENYERALQNESGDIKALNGLGVALDMLDNHIAAQQAYNEALTDKPGDITTLTNLGHSYVLTGAYDQAIQLLEPYVKDKTATPALRQNLAEAYGMVGMDADAERVARMDLGSNDVKRNLAYYRAQRAKLAVVPALYAELGHFATEAMAQAEAATITDKFPMETEGLVIKVQPEVKDIGSTPTFVVSVSGFTKPEKLRAFCDRLKKADMTCDVQDRHSD